MRALQTFPVSGLLHPFNENQPEERLIELVAGTLPTNWIWVVTRI
jgi:hypothetical protein